MFYVFNKRFSEGDKKPEMPAGTFFKPKFFDFMKDEYFACKEGVGVIDMSSFSKIELKVNTIILIAFFTNTDSPH